LFNIILTLTKLRKIVYENYGCNRTAICLASTEADPQNEYTRYGFRDLIDHDSAAILNADAQILGGVTEFMQVAALAAAQDLRIAPHGAQEIHIHLVAAIPNGLILEYYRETVDPLRGQIFQETLVLDEKGQVIVPDRPGLGVTPNYELLAAYRVE